MVLEIVLVFINYLYEWADIKKITHLHHKIDKFFI